MVFDAGLWKKPPRLPMLQPRIGIVAEVARFIEKDLDNEPFLQGFMLPLRWFRHRTKKDAPVAIGCAGARHTSVRLAVNVAKRVRTAHLAGAEGEARIVFAVLHRMLEDRVTCRLATGAGMTGAGAHP